MTRQVELGIIGQHWSAGDRRRMPPAGTEIPDGDRVYLVIECERPGRAPVQITGHDGSSDDDAESISGFFNTGQVRSLIDALARAANLKAVVDPIDR